MQTTIKSLNVERLRDERLYKRALSMCAEHRQAKAAKLKNPGDRRLCVGAWLLFSAMLKTWDIDVNKEAIAFSVHGKPYLSTQKHIKFNLSHSGETVLCAISNREVGCDVEMDGRLMSGTVNRCFHPEEKKVAMISGNMPTRIWTLKESVIKCTSEGFSRPFNSFSVCGDNGILGELMIGQGRYCLYELPMEKPYAAACCLKAYSERTDEIRYDATDLNEIMDL